MQLVIDSKKCFTSIYLYYVTIFFFYYFHEQLNTLYTLYSTSLELIDLMMDKILRTNIKFQEDKI